MDLGIVSITCSTAVLYCQALQVQPSYKLSTARVLVQDIMLSHDGSCEGPTHMTLTMGPVPMDPEHSMPA
jgi:hypothetical protein